MLVHYLISCSTLYDREKQDLHMFDHRTTRVAAQQSDLTPHDCLGRLVARIYRSIAHSTEPLNSIRPSATHDVWKESMREGDDRQWILKAIFFSPQFIFHIHTATTTTRNLSIQIKWTIVNYPFKFTMLMLVMRKRSRVKTGHFIYMLFEDAQRRASEDPRELFSSEKLISSPKSI